MRKAIDVQDQPAIGGLPPALSVVALREPLRIPAEAPAVSLESMLERLGRIEQKIDAVKLHVETPWYRRLKQWLWNLWGE